MKRKILTLLLSAATIGTAGLSPLAVHAAAPKEAAGAAYNSTLCQNGAKTIVANSPEELKQKLEELGVDCTIPDLTAELPENTQPCETQPAAPEQPEASQPETPDQPDNNQPGTPEQPETSQPEKPEQPASDVENADYVQQVVDLVNQERAKAGLSPVTADSTVQTAAQVRAQEIETSFSHTRPNGSSFDTALTQQGIKFNGCGENIAWGQKSPQEVMTGWMNSDGHRANILNAKYTKIGVGYHQNASGTNYWTQEFTY